MRGRRGRAPVTMMALAAVALLAGCDSDPAPQVPPQVSVPSAAARPTTITAPPSTITVPPSSSREPAATPAPKPGRTVVLDPGHNGGNAGNPAAINRKVPAGRGQTKPCNTTGTSTNAGYPEHAFNFDLATRIRALLTAKGVAVTLTRQNDSGVGPCVDQRAAIGNAANAAAVVSLHADGATSPSARGFHVAYSSPPLNDAQGQPSTSLASTVRDRLREAGFPVSTYIGANGLSPRSDLAGLNLSTRPTVLVECGNMRNGAEAATLSSAAGRQRYAEAIAAGIESYLS